MVVLRSSAPQREHCLCDIFAKLNKLVISTQRPDIFMFDENCGFLLKLLWKEDITNVSGSSQRFAFI